MTALPIYLKKQLFKKYILTNFIDIGFKRKTMFICQ